RRTALRRGVGAGLRAAVALAGLLAALALSVAASPRAEAYVRYKTASGQGFYWPQSCVPVWAYPLSLADASGGMELPTDQIMHAARGAATTWSAAQPSAAAPVCTYMRINVTEVDAPAPKVALDYTNALVFDRLVWCNPNKDGVCQYPAEALAITSVFV